MQSHDVTFPTHALTYHFNLKISQQLILTEYLLCVRHCPGCLRYKLGYTHIDKIDKNSLTGFTNVSPGPTGTGPAGHASLHIYPMNPIPKSQLHRFLVFVFKMSSQEGLSSPRSPGFLTENLTSYLS